jgi:hypothetical protein
MSVGGRRRRGVSLPPCDILTKRKIKKPPQTTPTNTSGEYQHSKGTYPFASNPPKILKNPKKIQVIHKVTPNRAFSGPPISTLVVETGTPNRVVSGSQFQL